MPSIPFSSSGRKKVILPILLLVLLISGGVYYWWSSQQVQQITVYTVKRTTLSSTVDTTGKILPQTTSRLAFPLSGRIQSILIKPGDVITTGTKLMTLSSNEAQRNADNAQVRLNQSLMKLVAIEQAPSTADVSVAKAELDAANARLAHLKAGPLSEDIDLAQAKFDAATVHLRIVKDKSGSSQDEQDEAKAQVDVAQAELNLAKRPPTKEDLLDAQAKIDSATAQLDSATHNHDLARDPNVIRSLPDLTAQAQSAQKDYDAARTLLAATVLTSTINGTILSVDITLGDYINPGQGVATVADLHNLEVRADVDEIDISRASIGQAVNVNLDAFPGTTLKGTVQRIYPAASDKQGSIVYSTIISFLSAPKVTLRPGMACSVLIIAAQKENILAVPLRAVETVGPHKYVNLVQDLKSQKSIKVEVTTGFANQRDIEIVTGLHDGEMIFVP